MSSISFKLDVGNDMDFFEKLGNGDGERHGKLGFGS